MKYVVLLMKEGETPIIFPNRVHHEEIADAVEHREVISAGFVYLSDGKITCGGASLGLGLPSLEEDDTILIQRQMTV